MDYHFLKKIIKKNRFNKKATIGNNVSIGSYSNCISSDKKNIIIGNNCFIDAVVYSFGDGIITIGNNCYINYSTFIGASESVKIGSHVIIATNVRIFDNNNHPTSPAERWRMCEEGFFTEKWTWKYAEHKPVVIEDNVWIGEYSTILKGVTIGKGAIVASNSVVTKDVPEYSVVAGNPAKIVKKLDPREEEKDEDTK